MRNTGKKVLSVLAAMTVLGSAMAVAGCGKVYEGDKIDYTTPTAPAASNGGFSVEYGDYVYFINGVEEYTANNTFGEPVKGALMRVKKADLGNAETAKAETVVPMLFVAQNFQSGIYIFGDYVYYATPTTDKNMSGEVENSWIDFKRAKLDGSEVMKDYYFRLSNNAADYRFVQVDGVVYCVYEEDSMLKSYNTANYDTKNPTTSVLVKGAGSDFFYDVDMTSGNVYYTMGVTYDIDTDNAKTPSYNQLYCVNAAATAEVNADEASYTVKGGKTYDFDKEYLENKNKEAKETKTDEPYDFKDYSTYPYVNLGTLVLDGIGSNSLKETQFNSNAKQDAATPEGYKYTIQTVANGGVYFTRTEIVGGSTSADDTKLYYLANGAYDAEGWNTVSGNAKVEIVAQNTKNTASALFTGKTETSHEYYYVSNSSLYKATSNANGEETAMKLAQNVGSATLWEVRGDYLYYYASATNGNGVSRIKLGGEEKDYNFLPTEEYKPQTVAYIDWNSSWYKPEFINVNGVDVLLYSNAQSFGGSSYGYIYAAKIGSFEEVKAENEAYEKVTKKINEYSSNATVKTYMEYFFQVEGEDYAEYKAVEELYTEYFKDNKISKEAAEEFKANIDSKEYKKLSAFATRIGVMNDNDTKAISEGWADKLLTPDEVEEEKAWKPWMTWTVVGVSVVVVAAAVVVTLFVVRSKKNKPAVEVAEDNRVKIDTTDDKTIDVYADETAETVETNEETVETVEETPVAEETVVEEVVVEETTEEAMEKPVEETVEASATEEVPVVEEPKTED